MRRLLRVTALGVLLAAPAAAQGPTDPGALRTEGVAAARAGRSAEGIALLERALRAAPQDAGIRADLVTVLMWAGRDREALRVFAPLGEGPATPGYALAAAAVSARRSGDPARAGRLYRLAIARGAAGPDVGLGLALAEAQRGNRAAALEALAEARARDPDAQVLGASALRDIERALTARAVSSPSAGAPATPDPGAAALAARRPFDALAIAEQRLARAPADRSALRLRVLALEQAGAPALALETARRHPGLVDAAEIRRLEGGAAAFLVRWGTVSPRLPPEDPAHRYAATDRALAALDAAIAAWDGVPEAAAARRTARLDRIVALRDRRRMADAIAEADALAADAPLPPYVRGSLGDAYLTLRQPEAAEREFRAALVADPGSVPESLGLFYALVEQRRWAEAQALVDALDQATPAFRGTRGEAGQSENWDKVDTAWAAALYRLFADDLPRAEARADALATAAPANTTLRTLRADVWRARGWPGAALEEAEAALSLEPLSLGLRISRAEALMDLRMWREAEEMILPLARDYPENTAVRRLARRWALHNRWELEATARSGLDRGSSQPELDLGMRLYSPPIAHDWRLFVGAGLRSGDTPDGWESIARGLVGVEYRVPAVVLRVAGTYDVNGVSRGGALAEAVIRLSDQWRIEANGETLATDTPLQALRNGITAGGAGAALVWRQNERREAGAQLRVLNFSDDNTRTIAFLRWTERVMSLPDWRVDLTPYAYATENSNPGGPYFSPRRDLEAGVTAQVSWVARRRYDRDLVVVGQATAGGYWQEDFGWSPVLGLRWENRQSLSDAVYVSYGAGWARRDYDGVASDAFSFTAALRWRM